MKRLLLAVAALLQLGTAAAAPNDFSACRDQFNQGQPPKFDAAPSLKARALCFDGFALMHSGLTKTPLFVAERTNKKLLKGARAIKRTNRFYPEARLPSAERATLKDYKGSGMDRGHLFPAGNAGSDETMAQSFSLANIVPQSSIHNRGAWSVIERDTRRYVMRAQGDVYVITGVAFSGKPATLGPNKVWIPSHLFKLVHDPAIGRSWAHWHENNDTAKPGKPISYEQLVERTGIEFLPRVPVAR